MTLERYRNVWQDIQSSLWFLPAILSLAAIAFSYVMPAIDAHLPDQIAVHRGWLFYGSPSAARTLLSTLAGSLITVIAVLFSITMLTLQQASSQFSSRVFRNFTDDRGVQWVLGTYIATFVYCILVLRRIRDSAGQVDNFVPALSITFAVVLAMICVALLVYYIHHSATLFQAATVIERVHHSLLSAIDRNYPKKYDPQRQPADDDFEAFRRISIHQSGHRIHATDAGYLRNVDQQAILRAIPPGTWATIDLSLGNYVVANAVLLESSVKIDEPKRIRQIRNAFVLGEERALTEDTLFGIRQMVDIAVRALSPGINDPTTAEHVISCLGDALIRLSDREFPSRIHLRSGEDDQRTSALWVNGPIFADYVESAFAQIRRAARNDVDVTLYLLESFNLVAQFLTGKHADLMREQVSRTVSQIKDAGFTVEDTAMLLEVATSIPISGERI